MSLLQDEIGTIYTVIAFLAAVMPLARYESGKMVTVVKMKLFLYLLHCPSICRNPLNPHFVLKLRCFCHILHVEWP